MMIRTLSLGASLLLTSATGALALSVTANDDPVTLVGTLLGSGVSLVGTPTFQGTPQMAGTFTGGTAEVGFGSGVVLTSGDVADIPGPNDNTGVPETRGDENTAGEDISTDQGASGAPGIANSFDASILEFDFQFGDGSVGGEVNFGYVFASEEYVNFIGSVFNDAFQLLINGVNVALVNSDEVSVNTVNDLQNSSAFINNVDNTDGIPNANLDIGFDGLTTVLTASSGPLSPGTHTARFVVADVADPFLDAGVFIQAGTFDPDLPPPPVIPLPASLPLALGGIAAFGFLRRARRS